MAREMLFCVLMVVFLATNEATRLHDWMADRQSETAGSKHNKQRAVQSADRPTRQSPSYNTHDQSTGNQHNNKRLNVDCFPTQQKFIDNGIGDASLTISSPTNDPDMKICYSGDSGHESCCTRTMEREYQRKSVEEYFKTVGDTSSYMLHLMSDNRQHYQELFLSLLNGAHNKTERLFSDVYHLPLMDRWGPTESLFLDLKAYLQQRNVSIHQSVDTFFDELFPLVFHNNVNDPRSSELDQDYRECLMQIRKDIYPPPFGGISGKLSHQLSRALGSARVFLEALQLAVRVINTTTTHLVLDEACMAALTRLEYCGHCDGIVDVAPCRGFCYNVMRGCSAHVTDMNIHWNEFIDGLELLTVNMKGSFDIEEVLHSLHSKVSEAIMHAMETGYKYSPKVVKRCGQPKMRRSPGVNIEHKTAPPRPTVNSALLPGPLELNARLYAKIEMFMRSVIGAKGFFSHVPDTVCSKDKFSASLHDQCWNGQNVSPYNKSIMTKDLSAQLQNPEVAVSRTAPKQIMELTDALQTFKKVLSSRVSLEQMQGDAAQTPGTYNYNYNYNQDYSHGSQQKEWGGYGSGDWQMGYYTGSRGGPYYHGGPMDDEDWYGSGSGSGNNVGPLTSRRPGVGNQPNDNTEFTFEGSDRSNSDPPYVTRNPGNPANPGELYNPNQAPRVSVRGMGSVFLGLCIFIRWL